MTLWTWVETSSPSVSKLPEVNTSLISTLWPDNSSLDNASPYSSCLFLSASYSLEILPTVNTIDTSTVPHDLLKSWNQPIPSLPLCLTCSSPRRTLSAHAVCLLTRLAFAHVPLCSLKYPLTPIWSLLSWSWLSFAELWASPYRDKTCNRSYRLQ